MKATASGVDLAARVEDAKAQLDAHVREIIEWHFSPETGCPFWLEFASKLPWSPRREISCFGDLRKFPPFRDEWLRGGPVRRWVPKGYPQVDFGPRRPDGLAVVGAVVLARRPPTVQADEEDTTQSELSA